MPSLRPCSVILLAALAVSAAAPPRAAACGGFACSMSMPVVQAAEQIIYVIGSDGSLTMSVRIVYAGAAPQFAWILPVPETPTITLGTEQLFQAIEPPTRPSFSIASRRDEGTCRAEPRCELPAAIDAGRGFFADAAASDGGGPMVFAEGSLGPYETVVLGGSTGSEIVDWLRTRGYDVPAAMIPLLDSYVAAGQRFVALRLRNDASTSDIQPITLGFGGVLPCLPIRLTSIATAPSLPITAYFLADARATPMNYSLVGTPFPASLYAGGSYTSWVDGEVDALGGHAFVADYAGATPSSVGVRTLPSLSDLATATDLDSFVLALRARGYASEPTLAGLIARSVTPPAGVTALDYARCVLSGTTATCGGAPLVFDATVLVAAIHDALTQPRADAAGWLADRPYLTRLYTTMSAAEMTLDPEFVIDPGLPDVTNVHTAVQVTECNATTFRSDARVRLDTDDGRSIERSSARTSGTDEQYCADRGGWLWGTDGGPGSRMDGGPSALADGAVRDAGPAVGGRGCDCRVARGPSPAWPALLGVAVAYAISRRRRARRLTAPR